MKSTKNNFIIFSLVVVAILSFHQSTQSLRAFETPHSFYASFEEETRINRKNVVDDHDIKILLYVTTHMSEEHIWILKACWPEALMNSLILKTADVSIYLNSPSDQRENDKKLLGKTFEHNKLTIHERDNQGYQEGAMAALSEAVKEKWFSGYDWVIRLNPDVILRDESFLLETIRNDRNATGVFVNCYGPGTTLVQTDFFAIKPAVLNPDSFIVPSQMNAEFAFTDDVRAIILEKGGHRWVPGAEPVSTICRVGYKRRITYTPLIHFHADKYDGWAENVSCPIPFL